MRRTDIDERVKKAFNRRIGARTWCYKHPPTFYYETYERYLKGEPCEFFWDAPRKYHGYREVDMFNAKWIHKVYQEALDQQTKQLLIEW